MGSRWEPGKEDGKWVFLPFENKAWGVGASLSEPYAL